DFSIKVWDALTGQQVLACRGHTQVPGCVAFSPDGRCLASASFAWNPFGAISGVPPLNQTGEVKIWDATTGQEVLAFGSDLGPIRGLAFSPDARWLALALADGEVQVVAAATGKEAFRSRATTSHGTSVVFSPDGKRLASASGETESAAHS